MQVTICRSLLHIFTRFRECNTTFITVITHHKQDFSNIVGYQKDQYIHAYYREM